MLRSTRVPAPQSTNEDTRWSSPAATAIGSRSATWMPAAVRSQVTLTATNGTITLSQTTGLSFTAGDGTADATMTFTGTIADINTALNGLVVRSHGQLQRRRQPADRHQRPGQHAAAAGALTDTDTVTITVNAVNDAPVNSVPAAAEHQRRHRPGLLQRQRQRDLDQRRGRWRQFCPGDADGHQRHAHAQPAPPACRSPRATARPTRR